MRVIAGDYRGRRLVAPKGDVTRPTADRTRETLFSMLTSRLGSFAGLRVADLFAGSGALGIEVLSRGAAHCLFVEQDGGAIDALRVNLALVEPASRWQVERGSVLGLGPAPQPLDLLLLDPPYGTGAAGVALDRLLRLGWIGPATWVSVELVRGEALTLKGLTTETVRAVGKAQISLLRVDA